MKKKLNEAHISNELRGQSAFFRPMETPQPEPVPPVPAPQPPQQSSTPPVTHVREPEHTQESKHASMLASTQDDTVEVIRKTVKDVGREVTFVRLTREEKQQLADIVYTYKRQGVKTSENEVGRIAINAMLVDYQAHGEESILAKVLAALLA